MKRANWKTNFNSQKKIFPFNWRVVSNLTEGGILSYYHKQVSSNTSLEFPRFKEIKWKKNLLLLLL